LGDSLSINIGRHQTKFGVDFNHINDDSKWDLFFPARIIFPTLTAFINHTPAVFWFPLLNGAATHPGFRRALHPGRSHGMGAVHQHYAGPTTRLASLPDEWKTTQKLTLTYGLRYDFETYPSRLDLTLT